jgi:excisionase family DNA binding protein
MFTEITRRRSVYFRLFRLLLLFRSFDILITGVKRKVIEMYISIDTPVSPSPEDIASAKEASRALAEFGGHQLTVSVAQGDRTKEVELPPPAVEILIRMLTEMGEGNAITLVPTRALLTTQQAADMLGVSRPFITQQMKDARIPFQKIGTHRRIALTDLVKYRRKMAEESDKAMNELVAQAQELGMGY